MQKYIFFPLFILSLLACNNGPKVIESSSKQETAVSSGIFAETSAEKEHDHVHNHTPQTAQSFSEDVHRVVVHEVLPTTKYVYLHVTEGVEKFWIATRKQEIQEGATYFYRGGLLKTNFESKEYNRVFDRIYLVSKLVPSNHGGNQVGKIGQTASAPIASAQANRSSANSNNGNPPAGTISIAELVANPQAYEGKTVQITGTCTKVNPSIMNRNWIHLKDGSKDDFDLVVTSTAMIPEGAKVSMKARVTLNKDFGAGYSYDLILEEGEIVRN